jgi:hypothetical protein
MKPRENPIADEYQQTRLRWWLLAASLAVAAVTYGYSLVYAFSTPVGAPPDEWAHITYIDDVARNDRYIPDYPHSKILNSGKGNYLGHPPLYYTVLGLVGRVGDWKPSADAKKYRVVSAGFVAVGLLLWLLTALRLGVPWYWTLPVGISVNAIPMFPYMAGSVNNDALAYLAVALAIHGTVLALRYPAMGYYVGGLGFLMALLTKATASLFLVVFFCVWLAFRSRSSTYPFRNKHFLLAGTFVVAICASYYLYAIAAHGTPFPSNGTAHAPRDLPADALNFFGIFAVFVKDMLGRLAAITSHASTFPVTGMLRWLFHAWLALPLIAYVVSLKGPHAKDLGEIGRRGIVDAFIWALLSTVLVHLVVVWHGYQVHGVLAGLQPRYYQYVLPGLFLLCFCRSSGSRLVTWLLGAFAATSLLLLVLVPPRALQAEKIRHAASTAPQLLHYQAARYRNAKPEASITRQPAAGRVDEIAFEDGRARVRGWAVDVESRQAADQVAVHFRGHLVGLATTGWARPDVVEALDDADARTSGFLIEIDGLPAETLACDLDLSALQHGGRFAGLLGPSCQEQ